jgi:hypothetical protein
MWRGIQEDGSLDSLATQPHGASPPSQIQGVAADQAEFVICDQTIEEGFRDAKWYLGFAESRVTEIDAWSRLFALFAIALLVLTTLGIALLIRGGPGANQFLRRVASRRSGRCELSLVSAMIALVQKDRSLFAALSPQTKLNLEATLSNVS